jgi:hypothetical protein
MSSTTRGLVAALALATMCITAGCGGTGSPGTSPQATSAAETSESQPVSPVVAEPTVAPAPTDSDAASLYGQDGIDSAYAEIVELATVLSFDPAYFFNDGDNTPESLAPVIERLVPEQRDYFRGEAQRCLDGVNEGCGNVIGLTYFDLGSDTVPYRAMPDGTFVVEQSLRNPTVALDEWNDGGTVLTFTFEHVAEVRLTMGDQPAAVTMTRTETYNLVPATGVHTTSWQIKQWTGQYQGDLRDPVTGDPVQEPSA